MDLSLIMSPIRSFQSMVQCAANTAESIPKEDMLMAFKTSINLLEKVGELMQYASSGVGNSAKSPSCDGLMKKNHGINYQNSFLNSFTNCSHGNVDFCCSQSSTGFRPNQEPVLFSNNRISYPSSDSLSNSLSTILPLSSSSPSSFAALNCLIKSETNLVGGGSSSESFLSNTANVAAAAAISTATSSTSSNNTMFPTEPLVDHDNCGTMTENSPLNGKRVPYLSMVTENGYHNPTESVLWTNRSSSPVTTFSRNAAVKESSGDFSDRVQNHKRLGGGAFMNFLSRPRAHETRKTLNSDELNRLLDSCEIRVGPGGVPGKKNYKCKFCGKMYDIKSSIRYHIRIIHLKMHLKTADMQCKLCGRVFTCATAANKHQLRCLKTSQNESTTSDVHQHHHHHQSHQNAQLHSHHSLVRTKSTDDPQDQLLQQRSQEQDYKQDQTIDDCIRAAHHQYHSHHHHSHHHNHHGHRDYHQHRQMHHTEQQEQEEKSELEEEYVDDNDHDNKDMRKCIY